MGDEISAWWEPWAFTRRRAFAEIESTGWFTLLFWVRVTTIIVILASLAIVAMVAHAPSVQVPWLHVGAGISSGIAFLFVGGSCAILAPVRIAIATEGILISQGTSSYRISWNEMEHIRLDDSGLLTVEWISRGKTKKSRIWSVGQSGKLQERVRARLIGSGKMSISAR
ncbi:MAG: hypothetical protein ACK54H_11045 [Phycisphaerales bacterium]